MTAGLNTFFDVYRMESSSDDEVGGAQITGTLVYTRIPGRLTEKSVEDLILQQGVEFVKTFSVILYDTYPIDLDIREQDEIELIEPYNHHYKDDRFRVIDSKISSLHPSDRRANINLTVTRSERSHANQ
ncbi:hypothetical protein GF373_17380 [bacterium]|nr:hypothetical protein [bacterium]